MAPGLRFHNVGSRFRVKPEHKVEGRVPTDRIFRLDMRLQIVTVRVVAHMSVIESRVCC